MDLDFLSRDQIVKQAKTALEGYYRFFKGMAVDLKDLLPLMEEALLVVQEQVRQEQEVLIYQLENIDEAEVKAGAQTALSICDLSLEGASVDTATQVYRQLDAALKQYYGSELDPLAPLAYARAIELGEEPEPLKEATEQERALRVFCYNLSDYAEIKQYNLRLANGVALIKAFLSGDEASIAKAGSSEALFLLRNRALTFLIIMVANVAGKNPPTPDLIKFQA